MTKPIIGRLSMLVLAVIMLVTSFSAQPAMALTSDDTSKEDGTTVECIMAPCEEIVVTSPTKSSKWQAGSTNYIKWQDYEEYGSSVKLMLSQYESTAFAPVIPSVVVSELTKNNGSFKWEIPSTLTSAMIGQKVVINMYFPEVERTASSQPFEILAANTEKPLTVTSPKAGTKYGYQNKNIVPIRWKPVTSRSSLRQIQKTVTITLSPVSTCDTAQLACPTTDIAPYTIVEETRNTGSYNWEVPTNLGSRFLDKPVQITVTVLHSGQSASSESFSIVSWPTSSDDITVSSPKSGETYTLKQTMPIVWAVPKSDSDNIQARSVRISLMPSPACLDQEPACAIKTVAPLVIAERTTNDGEYKWIIPNRIKSSYLGEMKILVEELDSTRTGTSSRFNIVESSTTTNLTITNESMPNGTATQNYEQYFTATGGTAPYYWSASISQSRVTYSMNETSGRFFASPTTPGLWRVSISVKDSSGRSANKLFTWNVLGQPTGQHKVGTLILGSQNDPTSVFLITEQNGVVGRMAFPNEAVFMSHGYKWSKLVPSSTEDQALPILGSFNFAPGSLIKYNRSQATSRAVYLVLNDKTVRPFASYEAFIGMGYTANMVWSLEYNFLANYEIGDPINTIERHPDGTDVIDGNRIYYIDNGQLRDYESIVAYNSWHTFDNDFSKVVPINSADKQLPKGSPVGVRYYPN